MNVFLGELFDTYLILFKCDIHHLSRGVTREMYFKRVSQVTLKLPGDMKTY